MNKIIKTFQLILLFVLALFSPSFAAPETVTITTYYPSPYGSYLKVTSDQIAVGSGYRASVIPTNGLIVEGQVGIGQITAGSYGGTQTELDVNGEIAANDMWIKNKGKWLSALTWCVIVYYADNSGVTPCPSGTYSWFEPIYGTDTTTIPTSGVFLCCS